ncbi:flagellar motor protein MotB [Legionella birminghamensis]|uniref:Chemotaxis protein MotB n=1 Tax=Legionella birminghamensis TaxID=28083 RepID=A0A378IBP4_9GAMM|nr:flagellar motor protein MotB [Legionella birminghamensis]KTC71720.1 flagellar motor protein MotB [Legionella birminghamensis]STX32443.1 chemotaxis protein MotB [Legionella birminghamensis]
MASKEETPPIIIKKNRGHHSGHHGGSWKIAYADFVTAMMAFFLLMWLLASLNKAQKEGLAEYFKQPLKISLISGDSMGSRELTVQGGGDNLKKKDGQVSGDNQPAKEGQQSTAGNLQQNEMKQLQELKSNIMLSIDNDPSLAELKDRMLMDVTSEGLRIQLIDNDDKPMFGLGSDEIDPAMAQILAKITVLLNEVPNKVTIQGHTDAHPYHNPEDLEQTNWELSTQRANTARRALLKAGLKEDKVMRVTGYASTVLLDKKNPLNPKNRRISIIVMKKNASAKLLEND